MTEKRRKWILAINLAGLAAAATCAVALFLRNGADAYAFRYTIAVRENAIRNDGRSVAEMIKSYMLEHAGSSEVYRYLRGLLSQKEGPHLSTLLAVMPFHYLL